MYSEELKYIKSGEAKLYLLHQFYIDLHYMFLKNKISVIDFEKEKDTYIQILKYELFMNRRI